MAATTKSENISWREYVKRLESEIKRRIDSESFMVSSRTTNGETIQYRPISELREELNMARLNAAAEAAAESGPFLSDCGL